MTTIEAADRVRAPTIVSATNVAKRYGSTRALTDCSIIVRAGEVVAVMGENGSGKSTLVKILSGVQRPDAGEILVDGARAALRSPGAAARAGIATVFQEVLVAPQRSILSNVWMGQDGVFRRRLSATERRRRARVVLEELLGECDLDAPAGSLSLSGRQAVCIARSLVREPKLLILDEATSALDVGVRDRLFAIVQRLCAAGAAVLFVSHRMDEIDLVADRAVVMRNGRTVADFDRSEMTTETLVRAMSGGDTLAAGVHERTASTRLDAPVTLTVDGLRLGPHTEPVFTAFRAGEIVGVAGLEGQGQDRFLEVLAGLLRPAAGTVIGEDGDRVTSMSSSRKSGIAYLPRDRRTEGVLQRRSILQNFALPTAREDMVGPFLSRRSSQRRFGAFVDELSIKAPDSRLPIESLSGGNQQKVVLSRWLATAPRILLLNDPTRGVDIGAKRDIYRALSRRAEDGCTVVMLSTEVDELLELMDRVLVFRDGAPFAELSGDQLTRQNLIAAYFGRLS